MANYGQANLKVEFDLAAGTLQDMSQYVQTINAVDVQALTEESDAFGDAWIENLNVGIRRMQPLTLGGIFDDTASTGPNVVFNNPGNVGDTNPTRTLKLTWGGTKTTTVEMLITSYKRMAQRGQLTKYEVTLLPSGAVAEA